MKRLVAMIMVAVSCAAAAFPCHGRVAASGSEMTPVGVRSLFEVEPKYDGHVLQAMTIHRDVLFQFYDSGRCRTYDFKSGEMIAEFHSACLVMTNHCGNANFGVEYPDGNRKFPALYVSGDLTNKCCYVLNVTPASSERIQTISFELDNDFGGSQVIVDRERRRIVYMQRMLRNIGDRNNTFAIKEFRLPALKEGDVTFTDSDVLDSYTLDIYMPIYQGACIHKGKIYQSYGVDASSAGLAVYDLDSHRMERHYSVKEVMPYEPQSVCICRKRAVMNFGVGLVTRLRIGRQ